jgi:hypothetical protein
MSARSILGAMIVGSVAIMFVAARRPERPAPAPVAPRAHERPWLSHEAAAQVIGPGGTLGPLFAGVSLGGPSPDAATRARIAAFARANGVDIRFEVADGELAAVRFGVTFGGCCGYEGADSLARQLGRPRTDTCCGCGERSWIDDWAVSLDEGIHVRGRVRVNRLDVRWEATASLTEVLDRAEQLIGKEHGAVREAAGDRWSELQPGHHDRLEVPYPFSRVPEFGPVTMVARDDMGLDLVTEHGRIVEVSFVLRELEYGDDPGGVVASLRARWGRPRTVDDSTSWTWHTRDAIITASLETSPPTIVIRAASAAPRS